MLKQLSIPGRKTFFLKTLPLASILTVLFLLPIVGKTQILESAKESIWLKPNSSNSSHLEFIGNYPFIDHSRPDLIQAFEELSTQRYGTLFIVGRPLPGSEDAPLLTAGSVELHTDKALVGNSAIPMMLSKMGKGTIYKVSYQLGSRKYLKLGYELSKHFAITEIIYYKSILSREQSRKVESYLAMKYSVNISENNRPELRSYKDPFEQKTWNVGADEDFDHQILALGRNDKLGLFQTTSFSPDSRDISISLSSNSEQGKMPVIDLENESLLILSQKQYDPKNKNCQHGDHIHPFKLRFQHWKSKAENLYLTIDSIVPISSKPLISDGANQRTVEYRFTENGATQLAIPLSEVESYQVYYLIFENPNPCELLCEIEKYSCLEGSANNVLSINLNPWSLPSKAKLTDEKSGQSISYDLLTESSILENIPTGCYSLVVSSTSKILKEEIVQFNSCVNELPLTLALHLPLTQGADQEGQTKLAEIVLKSGSTKTRSSSSNISDASRMDVPIITAYPNPAPEGESVNFAFRGFDDDKVMIEVFNQEGKLVFTQSFTPNNSNRIHTQKMAAPGTYLCRFTSGDQSYYKHIISL